MANQNVNQQKNTDKNQKQQSGNFTSTDKQRESDISKQSGTTNTSSSNRIENQSEENDTDDTDDTMGRADETSSKTNFNKR